MLWFLSLTVLKNPATTVTSQMTDPWRQAGYLCPLQHSVFSREWAELHRNYQGLFVLESVEPFYKYIGIEFHNTYLKRHWQSWQLQNIVFLSTVLQKLWIPFLFSPDLCRSVNGSCELLEFAGDLLCPMLSVVILKSDINKHSTLFALNDSSLSFLYKLQVSKKKNSLLLTLNRGH